MKKFFITIFLSLPLYVGAQTKDIGSIKSSNDLEAFLVLNHTPCSSKNDTIPAFKDVMSVFFNNTIPPLKISCQYVLLQDSVKVGVVEKLPSFLKADTGAAKPVGISFIDYSPKPPFNLQTLGVKKSFKIGHCIKTEDAPKPLGLAQEVMDELNKFIGKAKKSRMGKMNIGARLAHLIDLRRTSYLDQGLKQVEINQANYTYIINFIVLEKDFQKAYIQYFQNNELRELLYSRVLDKWIVSYSKVLIRG